MSETGVVNESEQPLVAAVVLTWNDTEMTSRCVASVLANDYPNTRTIVVDNGSDPPGIAILQNTFPGIDGVQLDYNTGFTGGCNAGLKHGLELGAKYLFLLNNDTIVAPRAISELVQALEARPDAGAASALLFYPGDERRIQFFRGTVFRDTAEHRHPDDGQLWSPEYARTVDTEFVPACALAYRAEALQQAGLFDESLFTNWEDYDLHLRLADHGWKLLTVGTAEVIHAHGQTTGKISPFITYLFTRNRLICLFRFGRLPGILRGAPHYARTLYWQIREYGWTNWAAHRAFLRGTLDFFLGVRGKGNVPTRRKD
ncbi:MAG: glycosyltransferase [Candidatus Hydrogenedens sp.]|nr:glycosyltransferase [Candidatus Hydrogenedens sp.]